MKKVQNNKFQIEKLIESKTESEVLRFTCQKY